MWLLLHRRVEGRLPTLLPGSPSPSQRGAEGGRAFRQHGPGSPVLPWPPGLSMLSQVAVPHPSWQPSLLSAPQGLRDRPGVTAPSLCLGRNYVL